MVVVASGWYASHRAPPSLLALRGYFVSLAPGVESSEPCRADSTDRRVVALPRFRREGTTEPYALPIMRRCGRSLVTQPHRGPLPDGPTPPVRVVPDVRLSVRTAIPSPSRRRIHPRRCVFEPAPLLS